MARGKKGRGRSKAQGGDGESAGTAAAGESAGTASAAAKAASVTKAEPKGTAEQLPRLPTVVALLAMTIVAVWFCAPVLTSGDAFGINDWDMAYFYADAARRSVSVFHQFPHWNPWYCGGSPLLANPQSLFLNPLFALTLAGGLFTGAKLQIVLHLLLGMVGAWLFGRRLGARGAPSLFAPAVYGLSSVYALHIATGHSNWFAMGYLPFAATFATAAMDRAAAGRVREAALPALGAGVALACVLFTGNAYFFVYLCLFALLYGVLVAASVRPWQNAWRPLAAGALVALVGLSLSAVKLLPMLEFLGRVQQYNVNDSSGAPLEVLSLALTGRDQTLLAHQLPTMQWRWWEYGAYVGVVPLLLAALGLGAGIKRDWRWAVVALFFLGVTMGNSGPVWPLLQSVKGFEGLRVPSRAVVFVVLLVAGFAAAGATRAAEYAAKQGWLPAGGANVAAAVLLVLVGADLFAVSREPLASAFTLPAVDYPSDHDAPPAFRQTSGHKLFRTFNRYSDTLDLESHNAGMVNCYERLHLPTAAQADASASGRPNPNYRGEVYLEGSAAPGGSASIASFSPNRVDLDVRDAPGGGAVVLNQNHDPGWGATVRTAGSVESAAEVRSAGGLLSVVLPASPTPALHVTLTYRAPRYGTGLAISLFALAGCALGAAWLWRTSRRREAAPAVR